MQKERKQVKSMSNHAITGFELQKVALHNLKHFGLKPTTKIVLWVLIDCYNPENGSVVFPSIEYIAETGDIGLTSAKEGIKELIKKGLIIKSKRDKVNGNYNKYLLTPKVQNSTSEWSENELFEQSKSDCFMLTNKKEKITNKCVVKKLPEKKVNSDEQILLDYAQNMGIEEHKRAGYVIGIKRNGGDAKIIAEFKAKQAADKYSAKQVKQTKEYIAQTERDAQTASAPTQAWRDLKNKLIELKRQ